MLCSYYLKLPNSISFIIKQAIQRATDCIYEHCKPELKKTTCLTTAGPEKDNHQTTTNYLKLNVEAVFESEG